MTGMEPAMIMAAAQTAKGVMDNRLQAKAVKAERNQAAARIKAARAIEDRKQKEALKSAQAKARARFGARGLSAAGGSAAALLRGLEQESATLAGDGRTGDNLKLGEIDADYRLKKRRNLLELADMGIGAYGKFK